MITNYLGNFDDKDVYYIEKTKIKFVNNSIIKLTKCTNSDDFYEVKINYKLYNRLFKLNNIFKTKKVNDIIKLVEYIEQNRTAFSDIFEHELVKELTKEIDREILKKLLDLK